MAGPPVRAAALWHDPRMSDIDHYENFPVASWLCPPALRPAIAAIYQFARTADDLADEGTAPAAERLAQLERFKQLLGQCYAPNGSRKDWAAWPKVFAPLADAIERHALPQHLLESLLEAFVRDVHHSDTGYRYPHHDALLDYCRLSANPVGRLLLHLYGINDERSLVQSDHLCSALQLINFWQDLSVDIPRGRWYVPQDLMKRHGVHDNDMVSDTPHAGVHGLMRELTGRAYQHLTWGAPLCQRVPGRAGWELRLVVVGGLRVLQKVAQLEHRATVKRPTLLAIDAPWMLWQALRLPRGLPALSP